jgi:hypothetical protein
VKRAADTNSVRRNVTGSKPIGNLDDNLPPPGDTPGKYFNLPRRREEEEEAKDSREVLKQLHTEEETKNTTAAVVPRNRRCPIVEVILSGF